MIVQNHTWIDWFKVHGKTTNFNLKGKPKVILCDFRFHIANKLQEVTIMKF